MISQRGRGPIPSGSPKGKVKNVAKICKYIYIIIYSTMKIEDTEELGR